MDVPQGHPGSAVSRRDGLLEARPRRVEGVAS
jgi:hypothetical protein